MEKDYSLSLMASAANAKSIEAEIWCLVPGGLIAGKTMSVANYWQLALGAFADKYITETDVEESMEKTSEGDYPEFLHLANVKIYSGGRVIDVAFARVKIRDVSAWSYGAPPKSRQ